MVADPKDNKSTRQGSSYETGTPLIVSVLIHIVVFLFIIFGSMHWKSDLEIVEPIPVQLVDNIGELTTTDKPPVKTEPKKPEPKKEEKKPTPKKEEKKPDPKKQEQDFNSLLNDLTPPDDSKAEEKTPEPANQQTSVGRFTNVLSMTEMDALRYQLSQCWSIMAGAMNAEDLAVELGVIVNPDRTVRSAKILDQHRYSSDPFFRAAADAAIRALNNPKCTPLNLPPEKYDDWREMRIVFDPKEMF